MKCCWMPSGTPGVSLLPQRLRFAAFEMNRFPSVVCDRGPFDIFCMGVICGRGWNEEENPRQCEILQPGRWENVGCPGRWFINWFSFPSDSPYWPQMP